jgi:hypothetical protein
VTDEVLDRLRDLHAAAVGGLERAADLDVFRKLLRKIFESVRYLPGSECATLVLLVAEAHSASGVSRACALPSPLSRALTLAPTNQSIKAARMTPITGRSDPGDIGLGSSDRARRLPFPSVHRLLPSTARCLYKSPRAS